MKRPVLFAFMVLCALFWTVMGIAPAVVTPKSEAGAVAIPEQTSTAERDRKASQTNALGLMVVSWIGVGVLWMTQRTPSTEAK